MLDQGDVGAGTTATSSRLIHGGLKYLERYDFRLVHESIRERHLLFRTAPHLVHDYPMLIPSYAGDSRPGPLIRLGLARPRPDGRNLRYVDLFQELAEPDPAAPILPTASTR